MVKTDANQFGPTGLRREQVRREVPWQGGAASLLQIIGAYKNRLSLRSENHIGD
jgi:hypothetical protein